MPYKPAPRLRSFDYLGIQRYFLTICTRSRRKTFLDAAAANDAVAQLRRTSGEEGFATIAYCFMPDHLHALAEGTKPSSDFKEFARLFKQQSSFTWKHRTGLKLWQRGYFDRVLRADEDTYAVARYILENPVRAGLARCVEEYPYSGSFTMEVSDLLGSIEMARRT